MPSFVAVSMVMVEIQFFCGHKDCCSGDINVLIYHMISQDNVIKGWSNIIGSVPSLVAIGTMVVEI